MVELVLASSLGVAPLGAVLWTGLLVDVVLGALILIGSARAIAVAILRVTFGALVVLLVAIDARVITLALVDALGSPAVLAALVGVPGVARRRSVIALFVAHVLGVVVFLASWRAPSDGRTGEDGWLERSPDFAVEVLGDAQSTAVAMEKALELLAAGAQLVWIVDPTAARVLVMTAPDHVAVVGAKGTLDASSVLPELRCSVSDIFAR